MRPGFSCDDPLVTSHRDDPFDAHGHPHGHTHQHGPAAPVSGRLRRVITAVLLPFAAVVIGGMVLLWPGGIPEQDDRTGVGYDRQVENARVTEVREAPCADVGVAVPQGVSGPCELATVEVTSGPHVGRTFEEVVPPDATQRFDVGQKVKVAYAPDAPEELQYSIFDVERSVPIVVLALIFAVVVVLVGRLRGLLALVGLVVTFMVLTLFILPAILQGSNPLLVAVFGGSAIMLATLYLCHGVNARTSVAVLGTLISLVMIGLLGSLFISWSSLSGNTDDQTGLVHSLYPGIEIRGLLLASILIGSLGVLDDVTVTQTSAVWELKQADPQASWLKLYGAGMRIGRDHIASVVNTLVLAYAGAALPLLLLFSIAQQSVTTVAFSELVAEEIVRTLIGSIGLVASVPITTVLAALVVSADREQGVLPAGGDGAGPGPGGAGPGAMGQGGPGHGGPGQGGPGGSGPAGDAGTGGSGAFGGFGRGGGGRRRRAKR